MDRPFVNIHTHRRTGEGIEVLSVMAGRGVCLPDPPFSIGVHPWQLAGEEGLQDGSLADALRRVEEAPAAAIGETGLDYAVGAGQGGGADHGEQKTIFAAQLRIAQERGLPVVLHCVRAFEPMMEILSGFKLPAVVFHGFVGSHRQAVRALRSGYYISAGERSFASPRTVEALRGIPLGRLLLETDDAPVPIGEVYSRAAAILGVASQTLVRTIHDNYLNIFGR